MENKEAEELRTEIASNIKEEIERLVYEDPSCDFEHIWNTAIDKASECCDGYGAS